MGHGLEVMTPTHFNPLDIDLLSRNLRAEMDVRPRVPLDAVEPFPGAGLYALYYTGDLPIYERLRDMNVPIYVGRAEAGNSSYGEPPNESYPKLFKRISDHRKSINEADNLDASDFDVRHLILDDIWIILGERALLRTYRPVLWNTLMTGFGSNHPGGGRKNARSIWDSIHPGRKRAAKLLCNRKYSRSEMEQVIADAIDISFQDEGQQRERALSDLKNRPAKKIWQESTEKTKPIRVFREHVFREENKRFGVDISGVDWVHELGPETTATEIASLDDLED
ncbi:Eco29kI family restriction endonuclease [Streptomonospora sp. S1-112]|uniref:Eco29kI family restriction endonuclease n=1 Tax=Streptomonospora mangrovi TaxID=2883123 RepID=A0A9X3SFE3_9ACTN|nr:Eco29kI family restriction endonuclease [Streptomonospora mangrovi]MDA0564660.1 Eco29kI family restriction endonuclease [Streptomonospora mangrovi]